MNRLYLFRIGCIALLVASIVAVYVEIYVRDLQSMTVLYLWAGAAIAALTGNAAAAVIELIQNRNSR